MDAPTFIVALHDTVDRLLTPLEQVHGERLSCRQGCSDCCVDDLTVFAIEADRIRAAHPELLADGLPHAPGACAFLDGQGGCRVYDSRPYVCRTQGLPLRWAVEHEGQPAEARDICPLNEAGPPIEDLPDEHCWTLGPVETKLAEAQAVFGTAGERVSLRGLFRG